MKEKREMLCPTAPTIGNSLPESKEEGKLLFGHVSFVSGQMEASGWKKACFASTDRRPST